MRPVARTVVLALVWLLPALAPPAAHGDQPGCGLGGDCNGLSLHQRQIIERSTRELDRLRRRALSDSRITPGEEQQIRSSERTHSRLKSRIRLY